MDVRAAIDRYVELRPLVNEHGKLGGVIKSAVLAGGGVEIKTPLGNVARLKPGSAARTGVRWVIGKLKQFLTPAKFRRCCPPGVDEAELNLELSRDPLLAKCREEYLIPAGSPSLEVIAAQ